MGYHNSSILRHYQVWVEVDNIFLSLNSIISCVECSHNSQILVETFISHLVDRARFSILVIVAGYNNHFRTISRIQDHQMKTFKELHKYKLYRGIINVEMLSIRSFYLVYVCALWVVVFRNHVFHLFILYFTWKNLLKWNFKFVLFHFFLQDMRKGDTW